MPVTEKELEQYHAFVHEQIEKLGCLPVSPGEIIWHYTNGEALLNIIKTGTIYATQVACLNDSSEVRYAENLQNEIFRTFPKEGLSDAETALLEEIVAGTEARKSELKAHDWFVACFAQHKDDLNQWRAYCGGENGYAIALQVGALFERDSMIVKVNYDKPLHQKVAHSVATATFAFYLEGLASRSESEKTTWKAEFLPEWSKVIAQLAPMVKDEAFSGEMEYRLIHLFKPRELGSLVLRQKDSLMSIHLPLSFPPKWAVHSTLLPISEIMIGPSRHKETSRIAVHVLLAQAGYEALVSMSSIPFQST